MGLVAAASRAVGGTVAGALEPSLTVRTFDAEEVSSLSLPIVPIVSDARCGSAVLSAILPRYRAGLRLDCWALRGDNDGTCSK